MPGVPVPVHPDDDVQALWLLPKVEGTTRELNLPGGPMDFLTTRSGVPILIDDETLYPVTRDYMQDIAIMDVDEGGVIDTLMGQVKEAVFMIAGIDPTLPHDQWYSDWQSLMTVLQFSEAIHVLRDAAQLSAQMREREASQ